MKTTTKTVTVLRKSSWSGGNAAVAFSHQDSAASVSSDAAVDAEVAQVLEGYRVYGIKSAQVITALTNRGKRQEQTILSQGIRIGELEAEVAAQDQVIVEKDRVIVCQAAAFADLFAKTVATSAHTSTPKASGVALMLTDEQRQQLRDAIADELKVAEKDYEAASRWVQGQLRHRFQLDWTSGFTQPMFDDLLDLVIELCQMKSKTGARRTFKLKMT